MLKEIREQPHHVRKMFMWISVVLSCLLIGFFWFRSTQKQVLALLNPEEAQRIESERVLAENELNKNIDSSPFATIMQSFRELRANISDIIRFDNINIGGVDVRSEYNQPQEPVAPQNLPITE